MSGLRTIVIGFGQIADGLRHDARMAEYFSYATHAQVLDAHPGFDWLGVVDPSDAALDAAKDWNVRHIGADIASVAEAVVPEVAVITAPPGARAEIVHQLPSLKAVMVEKPLGSGDENGEAFVELCRERNVVMQVNFWRRGDKLYRSLARRGLAEKVGRPQAVFATYGNGLLNNGCHLVDFIRMLIGEVETVQALDEARLAEGAPIAGDQQVPFALTMASGAIATVQPLDFRRYREVGLDIWGELGRLALYQESLGVFHYPLADTRSLENEMEIASDQPQVLEPTAGTALYNLYDNLAQAIMGQAEILSSADNALKTEQILDAVLASADGGGERRYFQ